MTIDPADDSVDTRLHEALAARFGACGKPVATGHHGRTWFVDRGGERLVVKHFGCERSAVAYVPLFDELRRRSLAPRLHDVLATRDGWFALFEFVDGEVAAGPQAGTRWEVIWPQALELLERLARCGVESLVDLHAYWMAKLNEVAWHDGPAELLLDRLRSTMPTAPLAVAHGDFTPQNFVCSPAGLLLIDWEDCGRAPAGFDAGWALTLTRLGVSYGRTAAQMRADFAPLKIDEEALRWSCRVGLLRVFLHARTQPLPSRVRAAMITNVRRVMLDELQEG